MSQSSELNKKQEIGEHFMVDLKKQANFKPCPICGTKDYMRGGSHTAYLPDHTMVEYINVECCKCGTEARLYLTHMTLDHYLDLVEKWNTRSGLCHSYEKPDQLLAINRVGKIRKQQGVRK